MASIRSTPVFKYSVISSLLLFFSIMFGYPLWTELWMIFGLAEIAIIMFFAGAFIWSIVYWINHRSYIKITYAPMLINMAVLILVIVLPLNFIRLWMKFNIYHADFDAASQMAFKAKTDTLNRYALPSKYQHLSINGGSVNVAHKEKASAVIFYTFLGVPDGQGGIVKVSSGSFDNIKDEIFDQVYQVKPLGDNWYYVMGN